MKENQSCSLSETYDPTTYYDTHAVGIGRHLGHVRPDGAGTVCPNIGPNLHPNRCFT